MHAVLYTADVAELLGVKAATIRHYRADSLTGGRYETHPFPEPDGKVGSLVYWEPAREQEIRKWADSRVGSGIGGGRPRAQQLHHLDAAPRNNDVGNLELRETPGA